ncbi:MAG: Ku protein [Alphaproteobacteria bacterium]|nr:Ku protein [Alphaproteobacteria bacterium]
MPDPGRPEDPAERVQPQLLRRDDGHDAGETPGVTRIAIRPHDPRTGEEIDKAAVVKGYEYERGQFVTFTAGELKALDLESSKVIDLDKFVPRGDIDSVYFDTPYYLHPDGPIAVQTLRVIGTAMAEAGLVGMGRLTLSRRERMVVVEPRGTGMALFTLRAADEVRPAQFGSAQGDPDAEMVAIAKTIIAQRTGTFDPATCRDRYSEALRELIEAKMKGIAIKPNETPAPPPVIDLMTALKRSLAQEASGSKRTAAGRKAKKMAADRRQPALLLPVPGSRKRQAEKSSQSATPAAKRRARG